MDGFIREYSISNRLTESQKDAVFAICNEEHEKYPFILNGPPGTGKTFTIVETIEALIRMDKKNRILVCAQSNQACDHVAEEVMKRFGGVFNEKNVLRLKSTGNDFKSRDIKFDRIIYV
jgi:superfamily II DNA or RNA helicase